VLGERPAPAAVQCIANLLDSAGGLKILRWSAKPRAVIAAARANQIGIMGIRAVQAGRAHYRDRSAAAGRPCRDARYRIAEPSGRSAPSSAPTPR